MIERQEWQLAGEYDEAAVSLSSREGFSSYVIMGQLFRAAAATALDPMYQQGREQILKLMETIRAVGTELSRLRDGDARARVR